MALGTSGRSGTIVTVSTIIVFGEIESLINIVVSRLYKRCLNN